MELYITTLGDFDIKSGDKSLLEESNRSYRIYKLLQYFLTFRNKKLLPETIIENLWKDSESFDPKNMLRAQIFRLRQMLKRILPEDEDETDYLQINFSNGYYFLEVGNKVKIDNDIFEKLISEGDSHRIENTSIALEYYNHALELYKGLYLGKNSYEIWIVPIRNHYSRLYLKTLFNTIEIYKEKDEEEKIIQLCEKAIAVEPYEEQIHICLMDAMLKIGQIQNARDYYDYIISTLEKEMKNVNSSGMKNIYRKIQSYYLEKGEVNIENIKNKLETEESSGPIICDSDNFKLLFNMQKRQRTIGEKRGYICLITLNKDDCSNEDIKSWEKIMNETLQSTLRKGDVYSFWNDTQILILLNEIRDSSIDVIEGRIRSNLPVDFGYHINMKFTQIEIEEDFILKSPN